jgi:protein ImuB
LPLSEETLSRLRFLGLRTLGQYAALPTAAVWQQFGQVGKLAHRLARGEDDRPVIARQQSPVIEGDHVFETPAVTRERVLAAAQRVVDVLVQELGSQFVACGRLRLVVRLGDGSAIEHVRTFLFPVSDRQRIGRAVVDLLDGVQGKGGAATTEIAAISVALEQIQEAVMEQLTLFSDGHSDDQDLRQVQRYLVTRFGASHLRRAALMQPQAPLPEWRAVWQQVPS